MHFQLVLVHRLNKTESAVILYCRLSFSEESVFQIIYSKHKIYIILATGSKILGRTNGICIRCKRCSLLSVNFSNNKVSCFKLSILDTDESEACIIPPTKLFCVINVAILAAIIVTVARTTPTFIYILINVNGRNTLIHYFLVAPTN